MEIGICRRCSSKKFLEGYKAEKIKKDTEKYGEVFRVNEKFRLNT